MLSLKNYNLYLFDRIDVPENRMIGYEYIPSTYYALCFWYFCILLVRKNII
jgi:hypothetical protein